MWSQNNETTIRTNKQLQTNICVCVLLHSLSLWSGWTKPLGGAVVLRFQTVSQTALMWFKFEELGGSWFRFVAQGLTDNRNKNQLFLCVSHKNVFSYVSVLSLEMCSLISCWGGHCLCTAMNFTAATCHIVQVLDVKLTVEVLEHFTECFNIIITQNIYTPHQFDA